MGLFNSIVAGIKQWVTLVLIDWIVVLVAAVVFVGAGLAGYAAFGAEVGWGIGILSAILAAYTVGTRLEKRLTSMDL